MASSLSEIDAYSKAKGCTYPNDLNPLSYRAAAEIERMKELYTKDLWNEVYSDTLNKCLSPDKTSKPKSKLLLLLCN